MTKRWPTTLLSFFAILIGVIGLAGWIFGVDTFKTMFPGLVNIKANTAICLISLGTSMLLLRKETQTASLRRIAQTLAGFAILVGLVSLGEHLFSWDFGIDQLLFRESVEEAGPSFPGRPGPASCLDFILIGSALALLDFRTRGGRWPAPYLAVISLPITMLAFLTHFYGVQPITSLIRYSSIALHSVLAFIALCAGILLARPEREFTPVFFKAGSGGIVTRRMLPAALLLPALVGWLAVLGRKVDLYGPHYGTALVVTVLTFVFSLLIYFTTRSIDRAEQDLASQSSLLRAISDTATQAIVVINDRGYCTFANPAAEKMLGYSFEELSARPLHDVIHHHHPDGRPFPIEECVMNQQLSEQAHVSERENVYIRKNREFFPALVSATPMFKNGAQIATVIELRDITERKRAEQTLREREAILTTVTNEARVGLVLVNRERRYLFANKTYADILGLPNADIVGQRVADVLAPLYDQISPRLDRAFAGERVSYELRMPSHPATRQERLYEVVYEPQRENPAEPYVVVVIVDITERKKTQETLERTVTERTAQLREINDNLQTFSYSAAHDLRSPLRSIRNFSSMVLEDFGTAMDPEARAYIRRIADSAHQMDHLLNDLLEYSKISQAELNLESVSLEKSIHNALNLLDADIRAKNAVVSLEGPFPSVTAHSATLLLLIQNLLSNALKFVPAGSQPKIRLSSEMKQTPSVDSDSNGAQIRLSVQDNGIGIAPSDLPKLFAVFQRLHGKQEYPGTGLGLAMVKKGVERMGGQVGAESTIGQGSCFWIELPPVKQGNANRK